MTDQPAWTPASMGRKGGSVRVAKGAAKLTKKARRELGKRGALARWGSKSAQTATDFGPALDRTNS